MPKSLIRNYGLRWHSSRVVWSGRTDEVGLWGVPARKRRTKTVDFANQVAIYVLYDGEAPVYVGQTGSSANRLLSRLKNHRADRLADRWDRFSWFGLCDVAPDGYLVAKPSVHATKPAAVLDQIEAVLVESVEPRLNRQGGQFGENVVRYLQFPDSRDQLTDSVLLKDLHSALISKP